MVQILFTTSNYPTSWLVKKITGEPFSHCAVRKGAIVIHSDFTGVKILPYWQFKKQNIILETIELADSEVMDFEYLVTEYTGKPYDFKAFFMLGLRYLFPKRIKKQNISNISGSYLCTEFVNISLYGEERELITPYKLYFKLVKQKRRG